MAKIIKNGITYTQDPATLASELVNGSPTLEQSSGVLQTKAGYVRATGTTGSGTIIEGVFKIFSGTDTPDASLGQNGDIYLKRVSS